MSRPASHASLTADQRDAACHPARTLLVVAGPGSGKTRVLTHRVAHLVTASRASPHRVLAVTFTTRAADEMRTRLRALLGKATAREVTVGTFHALGLALLREHPAAAGLPSGFAVYGPAEQQAVVAALLRGRPRTAEPLTIADVLAVISRAKQQVRSPRDVARRAFSAARQDAAELYAAYEAALARAGAVDLDDLVTRAVRLLEEDAAVRAQVQRRFRHVLVDEFQDVNDAQYRLLGALVSGRGTVTVVGDADQAIYGWRGAAAGTLQRFRADHAPAVVALTTNHRSTARIVAAAEAVVAPCAGRVPTRLTAAHPGGPRVRVVAASDEHHEADRIAARLQRFHAAGTPWGSMAVLYRTHDQATPLARGLAAAGVPHHVVGGPRDDDAVATVLAYLRLAVHPDDDAVRVTLTTPARGIGRATIDRLLAAARDGDTSLWQVIRAPDAADVVPARAHRGLAAYRELVRALRRRARADAPLPVLARDLLVRAGIVVGVRRPTPLATAAAAVLARLDAFARDRPDATLCEFLDGACLTRAASSPVAATDAVTLLTMHAAKGLEFDAVVVAGVEAGLVPHGACALSARERDEERRLLYVAMTRARRRLALTHAQWRRSRGTLLATGASPFLADLPDDVAWR